MQKEIYSGDPKGIYKPSNFISFMKRFDGAEKITEYDGFISYAEITRCIVYRIEGINLRYLTIQDDEVFPIHGNELGEEIREVLITLIGEEPAVLDSVEKRFKDAIKTLASAKQSLEELTF